MTTTEIKKNIQKKLNNIDDISLLIEVESIINYIVRDKEDL